MPSEHHAITKRASIVGLGTLTSRVLGLVRDLILAALFLRADTDLFFAAWTIPNAFRQLLAEGSITSSFVPVLARIETQEGSEAATLFYQKMRSMMILVLGVACSVGIFFAPFICELFVSGFHARANAFERTVSLTRVLFPYLFFIALAALGAGALQVRNRFTVAAFTPALLNIAIICAAIFLPVYFKNQHIDPLYALAVGAVVGGILQFAAQQNELRRAGFSSAFIIDFHDSNVREVFRRIVPMAFGLMIYEIDLVLSRRFLSQAVEGANSYFYYAQRLCDFPQGVFSLAVATAALPSLSKLAAQNNRQELANTTIHALRLTLFVALPATAVCVGLSQPLITAIFARGAFDMKSVQETSRVLMAQGIGIFIVATVRQLVPVFYALGDTRTPVLISALDLLVFIAIALGLKNLGHSSVSIAVSGSAFIQMMLLAVALHRVLPELKWRTLAFSVAQTIVVSLIALELAIFTLRYMPMLQTTAEWVNRLFPAIISLSIFAIVFLIVGHLIGHQEQSYLLAWARRKIRNRK